MPRTVKYTSDTSVAVCKEHLPGCDPESGTVHVCFEDGSGITTCRNCFDARVNEGEWTTDSTITIKAA
ncbi:MAG: hypothetical protein WC911_06630 [Thermoleophilia bacterium]